MPLSTADEQFTRVSRSKASAKDFYDRLSSYYDLLAASSERRYTEAGLHKLAVKDGESVLEIGFGTGQAMVTLARAVGGAGRVVGIDISTGMYRVARRRIQEAGLSHRVELCLGDAQSLPWEDARFDAVFISFTLELFDTPEIPLVLTECRRVLKRRGRICVVALSKDKGLGPIGQLYEWLHTKFPTYLDCRPIPIESILNREGFQVIEADQRTMWGLPVGIVLAEKQAGFIMAEEAGLI
jgi:demethylmenaquinone methyltransferase/2-methoxy-6-polyprenyl-1,4-benzoquinol methylase